MKSQRPDWFVWVQPLDDRAPDLMSRAGVPLSVEDHGEREKWLEEIEFTARQGRRRLKQGGFLSKSANLAMAELPLQSARAAGAPTAVVALSRREWTSLEIQDVLDDLIAMAARGQYRYDPGIIRRGLDEVAQAARPSPKWKVSL